MLVDNCGLKAEKVEKGRGRREASYTGTKRSDTRTVQVLVLCVVD